MDLIQAVTDNNVDEVRRLIDIENVNVNILDDDNDTPLLIAARCFTHKCRC